MTHVLETCCQPYPVEGCRCTGCQSLCPHSTKEEEERNVNHIHYCMGCGLGRCDVRVLTEVGLDGHRVLTEVGLDGHRVLTEVGLDGHRVLTGWA